MIGGVVEVSAEGRHLSKSRGFLIAQEKGEEVGRVPLDHIDAMVLAARSATVSRSLLSALCARGSVVIVAGENFEPECIITPATAGGHTLGHPEDQAVASPAFNGRLWKQLVSRKILHQAQVLRAAGAKPEAQRRLFSLSTKVKNGDPENIEASAARSYFSALFGRGFSRDRDAPGVNAHLNYGYAILRAACARSICAVGLSPALGIHHHSRRNRLCMADDLVELFRPLVDLAVSELDRDGGVPSVLEPEAKRHLAAVLETPMLHDGELRPCTNAIQAAATEIAKAYAAKKSALQLPEMLFQGELLR